MSHGRSLVVVFALAFIALSPTPAVLADGTEPWWAPRLRSKEAVGSAPQNGATDEVTAPAPSTAPTTPPQATPPVSAPAAAPQAAAVPAAPAPAAAAAAILPDAALLTTMGLVRKSALGSEPNAVAYLEVMTSGKATAAQVNDFAAYVAKRGMPKVALSFQEYALRIDPQNPTLWQNLGTIQRTTGSLGPAATSFKKAITLNPIDALAHYNLGAVLDAEGQYDDAIEEYRRALVLDPSLADPRKNPQVVNNENLLAVKLEIYRDQAGSLGLPLLQMQKPSTPPKAAAVKP